MHVHQWVAEAVFSFGGQGLGIFLSNEGGVGFVHQEKRGLMGPRP